VQHTAKAIGAEEIAHSLAILRIERDDTLAGQTPGDARPGADDLSRIALLEVEQGIVAGDAGDAGDEQRQSRSKGFRRHKRHEYNDSDGNRPGTRGEPMTLDITHQVREALEHNPGTMTMQLA